MSSRSLTGRSSWLWPTGRQVADNPAGSVGQSQLDGLVQLLDDIAERSGNLKDHHLTHGVRPDLRRAFGQAARP